MEIKVYFENNTSAELVATFYDEGLYLKVFPALEMEALKQGYDKVTESMEESPI